MLRILVPAFVAAVAVSACSTTPTVTKQKTTMTVAQINEAGLQCRELTPIDSTIPRTICASEKSWAAYDRRARLASEELFAEGRKIPNAGRFNRN